MTVKTVALYKRFYTKSFYPYAESVVGLFSCASLLTEYIFFFLFRGIPYEKHFSPCSGNENVKKRLIIFIYPRYIVLFFPYEASARAGKWWCTSRRTSLPLVTLFATLITSSFFIKTKDTSCIIRQILHISAGFFAFDDSHLFLFWLFFNKL